MPYRKMVTWDLILPGGYYDQPIASFSTPEEAEVAADLLKEHFPGVAVWNFVQVVEDSDEPEQIKWWRAVWRMLFETKHERPAEP